MWTLLVLCSLIASRGFCGDADAPPADGKDPAGDSQAAAADAINPAAQPSCRGRCGGDLGSCSCTSSCQNSGNCCHDYSTYCPMIKAAPQRWYTSASRSCRYNCGYHLGSCSCSSSCRYNGNCCRDYSYYCSYDTTAQTETSTTGRPSCRYNCGYNMGSCSCSSSCQYYGNCCYDYNYYCYHTTSAPVTGHPHVVTAVAVTWEAAPAQALVSTMEIVAMTTALTVTAPPSCRHNCGFYMGSCSCSSSCWYNGNCCHDYNYYCSYDTTAQTETSTTGIKNLNNIIRF
ncbi:keratin-associated protein 5-3 [Thalassophryne amazonica]|uniref:keratin-associated protein 5-3 n=1 Tax=Thalassophryne amazonica TaxID=390379 RepID=UPI0014723FA8|nr:keratin-associated protein 5-3 [Thalassophryne amazonica]